MGISRDSRHKHRATGGRFPVHKKKRKYELGRPPAMTKLGPKRVRPIRARGGNMKYRGLKLDAGNFSWASQQISRKARVLDVCYNASNNELVRTKTLVKNCIVSIDATPFRTWYRSRHGVELSKKKLDDVVDTKKSRHVTAKQSARASKSKVDPMLEEAFTAGRLLACVSSRPGQTGRCDGYILEVWRCQPLKK
eukprot:GHVT01059933.1.p1 GENE.GHVT01059933.1~~GHVT01059933.1.p1  ORF type:complete len:194 (-),score=32.00 GHVT01059933.1:1364-1945(-)